MTDGVYQAFVSAETLFCIRRRLHETQEQFAGRFGVTRRTIIRWEQKGVHFAYWQDKSDGWRKIRKDKAFTDVLRASEKPALWSR